MKWPRKVLAFLQYARDPEAHHLLNEVLQRVDALAKQAHLPVHPPAPPVAEERRDCGHVHRSAVTDPDTGTTMCGDCATQRWANYQRPIPPSVGPRWR